MFAIPAGYYTIDSSTKTITILSPFDTITTEEIYKIIDITSGEIIYDADNPKFGDVGITTLSGSVTYNLGNNVTNTDKMRILIDSSYINGGSA